MLFILLIIDVLSHLMVTFVVYIRSYRIYEKFFFFSTYLFSVVSGLFLLLLSFILDNRQILSIGLKVNIKTRHFNKLIYNEISG